jgi:hypothetical protein
MFYLAADGKIMAVDVKTSPKFESGAPKALFDARIASNYPLYTAFRYDVTADGKRFIVNNVARDQDVSASAPITVVLNWQAALKH